MVPPSPATSVKSKIIYWFYLILGTGGGDDNNGGGGSGGVIIVNGKSTAMNCTASIGLIFTYVIISIVTISFRI